MLWWMHLKEPLTLNKGYGLLITIWLSSTIKEVILKMPSFILFKHMMINQFVCLSTHTGLAIISTPQNGLFFLVSISYLCLKCVHCFFCWLSETLSWYCLIPEQIPTELVCVFWVHSKLPAAAHTCVWDSHLHKRWLTGERESQMIMLMNLAFHPINSHTLPLSALSG